MSADESAAYFFGRSRAGLDAPYEAIDSIFGGERLDGAILKNANFEHCTFANISFKKSTILSSTFLNCVFIGCYFRRAEFSDSSFTGCRFIDCNFAYVAIRSSRFPYTSFKDCQLPFAELLHSLPPQPNLRENLSRNLALESSRLGLAAETRLYRMSEIRAREEHLKSAVLAQSQWYKQHFDALGRVRAAGQLLLSHLNRWLWGYGENAWILVRNFFLFAFIIFPGAFYFLRDGLQSSSKPAAGALDVFLFSLENVVPSGVGSDIVAIGLFPRLVAGLESLFGVVVIALFASYVLRWSLHR